MILECPWHGKFSTQLVMPHFSSAPFTLLSPLHPPLLAFLETKGKTILEMDGHYRSEYKQGASNSQSDFDSA